ncbi:hypothetical protein U9M48_000606 [Paspalum notatum var. saurae]|uniref:Uncharacterized protein n=1 Tax=Paspalum notatum var. saurae TaxID=547442 RepID=A0AAQ3SG24_PASNO
MLDLGSHGNLDLDLGGHGDRDKAMASESTHHRLCFPADPYITRVLRETCSIRWAVSDETMSCGCDGALR